MNQSRDATALSLSHSLTRNHGVHVVGEAERHPDEQRRNDRDEEGDARDHQRHAPTLLLVRRRQQVLQRLGREGKMPGVTKRKGSLRPTYRVVHIRG